MTTQEIVEQLKTKGLRMQDIHPADLFYVIKYYWQQGNVKAMQALVAVAKKRLEDKNLKWVQGIGWTTNSSLNGNIVTPEKRIQIKTAPKEKKLL